MTRCDEISPTTTTGSCDCEGCQGGDLPVNPFLALRVAYGMLLGEDDFRVLMGSPRGKQMLHTSWLHGSGVIWGYDVQVSGKRELRVSPGLAVDGIGRELLLDPSECLDVRDLIEPTESEEDCSTRTIEACVVARFDSCLGSPVPTLADPCDVTRKHDDYSRVVERAAVELRPGCCSRSRRPYHRVRVLLGLARVGNDDPVGEEALALRHRVAAVPGPERAGALLAAFRHLAALDGAELQPAQEQGDCYPTLFPETEEDSAVVLACVEVDVRDRDGCPEITAVRIDLGCRTALLPTATIQELTCGLAPGLLTDGQAHGDAGGPRVIGEEIALVEERRLVVPVTAPLARGSLRGSVSVSSMTPDRPGGWLDEDSYGPKYDRKLQAIVVHLDQAPRNRLIRVVVKGTGPRPVMGRDPLVPLAGVVGGPPGTAHDGHDAVWIIENPIASSSDEGDESAYDDEEIVVVEVVEVDADAEEE
jgi:hypothetical protein